MNKTSIAWTDYTSNPIRARNIETGKTGHYCTHVSEGCDHCYAGVWNRDRFGTGLDFIAQNRDKVEMYLNEAELREWSKPKYAGAKVFVCDMTDWCHELVTDEMRDKMFAAMALAPQVTFQLLTKRPERMREYLADSAFRADMVGIDAEYVSGVDRYCGDPELGTATWPFPLPNVWLGVTAENQRWAEERIPVLLDTPAAVRFVSYEPALGPLDLFSVEGYPLGSEGLYGREPRLDWIIVGGESGSHARPFDAEWARTVRDDCEGAVQFFMKQMGGKLRPDDRLESLPEDLRVREFPR